MRAKITVKSGTSGCRFGGCLPVCVQALGTSAPDRPVHLQDLTVIAMAMGKLTTNEEKEKKRRKENPKTQRKRMSNQTSPWVMNERNQEIIKSELASPHQH